MILLNKPSELSYEIFMDVFQGIYEHSTWVAEATWRAISTVEDRSVFDDVEYLSRTMQKIVDDSSKESKLALLNAHPDLAGKAALAGALTADSTNEQAGAGLDTCTENELALFHKLNSAYKEKNGFPFIMAVKGASKYAILDGFAKRIENDTETEFLHAVGEVHKIAFFRLQEK
ncbi:2-oxo-4-hydroxy-4-carboxy-5-ureidoimidazoline decarboxylase [Marinomonas sp. 15G1-11]|uniref:2-oxo-4-hydroxy-4-carboxy-5-ureidoimidazoline decarboxylase n=1 Tax=Marinomonas phaeophyticola TaxID=3004091 RepID=A0ABT4JX94_9GAMM|nr:2-oxo-4-hydroxy-4-carboxy-5-ureidoimidazoline decarboxylase [Marinomonas sp. 15G1-11]MCZ2723012.1 2-oxo-4-hydroxy-4-carboxy-5-ureidoimidazoline decarboxylase [Marinomonas sp. 15G1-11]